MLRGTLVRGRPCGAPSHGMEASAEKEGVTGQSSTWARGSLDGRRGTLFPAPCCPRAPFSRQQTLFRAKSSRKLFYLRQARGKLFGVEHRVGAFSLSHPSAASRPYQGAPLNLNIQMCPPKKLRPRHRRHEPRSQDTSACSPPPLGSDAALPWSWGTEGIARVYPTCPYRKLYVGAKWSSQLKRISASLQHQGRCARCPRPDTCRFCLLGLPRSSME